MKLSYRNINIVFLAMFFIGVAVLIVFLAIDGSGALAWAGIGVMLLFFAAGFVLKLMYWKCPHCNGMLPWKVSAKQLESCPSCWEKLDWS